MPDKTTPHIKRAARAIYKAIWDARPTAKPCPFEARDEPEVTLAMATAALSLEPSEEEITAATAAAGKFIYQGPGPQPMELKIRARECAMACLIAARRVRVGE